MKEPQTTINCKNKKTLDYNQFIKTVHESINMNCEDIINIHNKLMGVTDPRGICQSEYGEKFMLSIINYDFGYCFVKETPKELLKFFNSTHTSNYLKQLINKYNNNQSAVVSTLVNSDKELKEFDEDELYSIYEALDKIGFGETIIALAFKLDSKGAINFLNNKVNPIRVIKRILYTSGLSARPEYYSGRGARISDLNGKMLFSIYEKLSRLDYNKGLNMVNMTLNMKRLRTSEFLESLYTLVSNNYNQEFNEEQNTNIYVLLSEKDETPQIKQEFETLLPEQIYFEIQNNKNNYQRKRVR